VNAFATEPDDDISNTVISVSVPDSHKITVTAENAKVFYEGVSGEEFEVARLSESRLLIRAENGKVISTVTVNGTDVTEMLRGGYLELEPVYEDKMITVTTEDEVSASVDTYTVKGKVMLNGQPLKEVDLELRSTLKTTKTDNNGCFVFEGVEMGEHSLTALKDGKVIGYIYFALRQDANTDVTLLADGTYTVLIDKSGAGIELNLELNEEKGILTPNGFKTVEKAESNSPDLGDDTNLYWWWLLLILCAIGITASEIYYRKKKVK
jgi:hypothetical protein